MAADVHSLGVDLTPQVWRRRKKPQTHMSKSWEHVGLAGWRRYTGSLDTQYGKVSQSQGHLHSGAVSGHSHPSSGRKKLWLILSVDIPTNRFGPKKEDFTVFLSLTQGMPCYSHGSEALRALALPFWPRQHMYTQEFSHSYTVSWERIVWQPLALDGFNQGSFLFFHLHSL